MLAGLSGLLVLLGTSSVVRWGIGLAAVATLLVIIELFIPIIFTIVSHDTSSGYGAFGAMILLSRAVPVLGSLVLATGLVLFFVAARRDQGIGAWRALLAGHRHRDGAVEHRAPCAIGRGFDGKHGALRCIPVRRGVTVGGARGGLVASRAGEQEHRNDPTNFVEHDSQEPDDPENHNEPAGPDLRSSAGRSRPRGAHLRSLHDDGTPGPARGHATPGSRSPSARSTASPPSAS